MTEYMSEELGLSDWKEAGFDVVDYIYDMPLLMAAADIVLCRSGASTLAELTAIGKPAILVPSPNVVNNHQEKNARVLERGGGAVVLLESDAGADVMLSTINGLLSDKEKAHRNGRAYARSCRGERYRRDHVHRPLSRLRGVIWQTALSLHSMA